MAKPPDLKQVAKVPQEIIDAGMAGELVLFVGAGVSMLRGLPSWVGFAQNAIGWLREIGLLNFAELAQLSRLDPKKQLSVAKLIAEENGLSLDMVKILGAPAKASTIYDYINSIGCVCVTTNYDEFLEPKYSDLVEPAAPDTAGGVATTPSPVARVNEREKFLPKWLDEPGTVIHLHGSISNPSTMVVTTQEYLEHYESLMVKTFLRDLFSKKTVLFLGYGLDELEVMEFALRRGNASATNDRRRFALQGYFLQDAYIYQRLHNYYESSFGVHLIGFALDHENFAQQEPIMRDWSERIKINKPPLVNDLAVITSALANG